MSPAQSWEPAGNAVHRLILYLDVLAIALHQVRELSRHWTERRKPDSTTAERDESLNRLCMNFVTVRGRVFPTDDAKPFTAKRLATEATAAFASVGRTDAVRPVREAEDWLREVAFVLPFTAEGPAYCDKQDWEKHFNDQGELLFRYERIRNALVDELALASRTIPHSIHKRVDSINKPLRDPNDVPISFEELMRWLDAPPREAGDEAKAARQQQYRRPRGKKTAKQVKMRAAKLNTLQERIVALHRPGASNQNTAELALRDDELRRQAKELGKDINAEFVQSCRTSQRTKKKARETRRKAE